MEHPRKTFQKLFMSHLNNVLFLYYTYATYLHLDLIEMLLL